MLRGGRCSPRSLADMEAGILTMGKKENNVVRYSIEVQGQLCIDLLIQN